MPEHVHLLLWPPFELIGKSTDPASSATPLQGRVDGILKSIKLPVSKKAIGYLREFAPGYLRNLVVTNRNRTYYRFWQPGSGFDKNVTEPSDLHSIVEYIHMNPVRRGLVDRPEQWPWSSARDWMGFSRPLIHVDRTIPPTLEIPWTDRRVTQGI